MNPHAGEPLYRYLSDLSQMPNARPAPAAVALGVFDGVHVGHQALLRAACEEAERGSFVPAALTFDPPPSALFAPTNEPFLLSTLVQRAERLREAGAEAVWVARFDGQFAALSPDDFVQTVLLQKLNARAVVIGDDFQFGKNRGGNADFLSDAGQKNGFRVRVVPTVLVNGTPARSTVIRNSLRAGQVENAARLLGRPYTLLGKVVHGRKMGRTLGYPTANLDFPPAALAPGAGVYAGRVLLQNGETFRAAVSVGTNPTVTPGSEAPRTVEAYLMNGFSSDLYGQEIAVSFTHFLRPTVKFDGLDALIAQMSRDVEKANRLLS